MKNLIEYLVRNQAIGRGIHYDTIAPNHRISWGNSKLKADGIASFNIPPVSTCPGRGDCENWCYATVGQQWFPSGYSRRVAAFKATLEPDFPEIMAAHIKSEKVKILRIHDSGDFYSPQYMLAWFKIAEQLPNVTFYAYTKQLILLQKLWDKKPTNFKLIQSTGGKFDNLIDYNKPHARIFESVDTLLSSGYTDTSVSDLPAATPGVNLIGLVIHGAKKKRFKGQEKCS